MSIPPLVCSTPPPPDQCEDDKDPEDFDLNYNLSQDDDFDYGSFSTYSHFQSAISESKPSGSPIINKINSIVNSSDSTGEDNVKNESEILQWSKESSEIPLHDKNEEPEKDIKSHSSVEHGIESKAVIVPENSVPSNLDNEELHLKIINIEEPNVEDLNLSVEESFDPNLKDDLYGVGHSGNFDSSNKVKEIHIPDMTDSIHESAINEDVLPFNITLVPMSQENIQENQLRHDEKYNYSEMKIQQDLELTLDVTNDLNADIPSTFSPKDVPNSFEFTEFGDINDFQSTSDTNELTIDTCVNPWGSNQPDSDFGAFEAHFDEAESIEPPLFQGFGEKSGPLNENENENIEDDDDFGDFDDFKSSTQETTDSGKIQDPLSQVPVLNLNTSESESQVLENINKILNEIFVEEIPVPENVFDGKLESFLCETWGHLLETDVRQPYIVNWNSSIGQKTLLKALCIDSRNILFGPKWNSNMPKYAANLSAAPLQPQKQAAAPAPGAPDALVGDKAAARPSTAWSDPFTADGQESCNKENNAAAQKRPSDLNVLDFESTLPSKSDKIYSSTLGIQPLRQISLPDTHIFTPTDSETPRSKTIHYDEPSVFLSQTSIDNDEKSTETSVSDPSSQMEYKTEDYSEFQDFKGSFTVNVTQSIPAKGQDLDSTEFSGNMQELPTASAVYPTGILQPIKLEPSIPTLNWPSPGEVKETFDDFSEFASNTTWNSESQPPNIEEKIHTKREDDSNTMKLDEAISNKNNDSFDDEFDTFQSALPTSSVAPTVSTKILNTVQDSIFSQNISAQSISNKEENMDFSFSDIHTVKSEPISLTRPIDVLKYSDSSINHCSSENTPKAKEGLVKIPAPHLSGALSMPANVLQPALSASQVQQNTTQILQPLSLESFSQINWPNPGIDLQDLSRFNPVETLSSLKSDLSVGGNSKGASPVHNQKSSTHNQEDDIWGEFVSSKPKPQQSLPKKVTTFVDDDEWTDFVSSPTVKPQNGLSTISLNVHTNSNMQKAAKQSKMTIQNKQALEIPTLNYITPKSSSHSSYNDRHFQNL